MNIFNKVTLQSLKRNKTRTIVTVIGIILSAAMICAVTTSVVSLYRYLLENEVYNSGNWHGKMEDTDWQTYKKIEKSDETESAVYFHQLGYAVADGCKNEYKPYLYIIGASQDFEKTMPVHVTKGRYPASASEIIIPQHLYYNGGVKTEIGDVLTLEIGNRMIDGFSMTQANPYLPESGEKLEVSRTGTYEVVGFYERPSFEDTTAPGYTAITVCDKEEDVFGKYNVYYKLKNPGNIYTFIEQNKLNETTNRDVLMYSGVSDFDGFTAVIYSVSAIVILLIMFGSVSLIYNAFSISVSERSKQFGLLSSVGATKKQLRRMVLFEAFAVSIIAIPIGVISGIGGIGITLNIVGQKISEITDFAIPMKVYVSLESVAAAVVIALVTVVISAWIPSKRATKVSAIDAIRQSRDVSVKRKEIKTSPFTEKFFGLPGVLAAKHYKRSRKKYRTTVVSLFMSIVLFVSASALTEYLMETIELGYNENNIDVSYFTEESHFEKKSGITKNSLLNGMKNVQAVTDAVYVQHTIANGTVDKKYVKKNVAENFQQKSIDQSPKTDVVDLGIGLIFVNDDEFEKLIGKYNLDRNKYFDKENPLGVVVGENTVFDIENKKYVKSDILKGDESEAHFTIAKEIDGYYRSGGWTDENGQEYVIYSSKTGEDKKYVPVEETQNHITLKSGKKIEEKPYYCNLTAANIVYIFPECMIESFEWNTNERSWMFHVRSTDHRASNKEIKTLLLDNGFSTTNLFDYGQEAENERNIVMIIKIFAYGFIVLISLISAANVFNTISTNIALRRREFAMLKSVGMTEKGFNKMMNFECLFYGIRSLTFGIPVSVGITVAIWYALSQGYELPFTLPWGAMGIAVLSVFIVVFATMMFSMSKIKKENPIDALKNENI